MNPIQEAEAIERAVKEGRQLVRAMSCRKCQDQADHGKPKCGYCNLKFEYLVKYAENSR